MGVVRDSSTDEKKKKYQDVEGNTMQRETEREGESVYSGWVAV